MVDAPEKIWAFPWHMYRENLPGTVEYVRADLVTHTVDENILLERQIAELRAERDHWLQQARDNLKAGQDCLANLETAEAENARLRALPLKDEVERVLEEVIPMLQYSGGKTGEKVRALLSRLRAGAWTQCGWAYQDKRWDEGRWHVCGMDSKPRATDDRLIQPVYVATAPSEQGGDRDANR